MKLSRQVRQNEGFTLIEVLVSVTVLSLGMVLLGPLLVRSARQAQADPAVSYPVEGP